MNCKTVGKRGGHICNSALLLVPTSWAIKYYLSRWVVADLVDVSAIQPRIQAPFLVATDQGDMLLSWSATLSHSSQ